MILRSAILFFLGLPICFHFGAGAAEVLNAGVGGNSTGNLLNRLDRDVLSHDPTVVVILAGTNDHINSSKLHQSDQYENNLLTLVKRIRQQGSAVILVTPPPCLTSLLYTRHDPKAYGNSSPEERLVNAAEIVKKMGSEQRVPVVDFHQHLVWTGKVNETADSVIRNPANGGGKDGVHPTAEGYAILARLVYDKIREYRIDAGKVVCFGDSITYGAGMKGAGTSSGQTYPAQLKGELDRPVRRDPLVLRESGTVDKPALFDGKGIVIDLGIDITDHPWKKEGDLWISQASLLSEHDLEPRIAGQTAGLFVGNRPVSIPRDLEAESTYPDRKSRCYVSPDQLKPGQMGYTSNGSLYFRWPEGIEPGTCRGKGQYPPLTLPPNSGTNAVSIACSHLTIRHVTARHAGNDGFNIHGNRLGIRLESVRSLANADEGISAHEATEMIVTDSEIAWNGSTAGGVADVNDSKTRYTNCQVHGNYGAAFFFSGKSHEVRNSIIFNQQKDFSIRQGTKFSESGNRSILVLFGKDLKPLQPRRP